MKRILFHICFALPLVLGMASCRTESVEPDGERLVEVKFPVCVPDAESADFGTKATDAEERALKNLYIYVFSDDGRLKGFRAMDSGLVQNTSSDKHFSGVVSVSTTSGNSYIYAVANVFQEGTYPLKTTMKTGTDTDPIGDGDGLPINLSSEAVKEGNVNFTRKQFLALPFNRKEGTIQISSSFLMTGAANGGNAVVIDNSGNVTSAAGADIIKLRRVVAKVRFNVSSSGPDRSFSAESYEIRNVAKVGSLFSSADAGVERIYEVEKTSANFDGMSGVFTPNDVDASGKQFFEVYLPENKQSAVNAVSAWNAREADDNSVPKKFVNAPEYGTYVVLHGTYVETGTSADGTMYKRNAVVSYFIHLGNCGADLNDYNLLRNNRYTYDIVVEGVDKIKVEAEHEDDPASQGTEGIVMDSGHAGKTLTLDSHYEYMVMRFWRDDIEALRKNGQGCMYQVQTFGNSTDVMHVYDYAVSGSLNGVDTDWIEFAFGGAYGDENGGRGKPAAYPGKTAGGAFKTGLYDTDLFLRILYQSAELGVTSPLQWTDGEDWPVSYAADKNGGRVYWTQDAVSGRWYVDATCFISENYYTDRTWDKFVNDVPKRVFYVANTTTVSDDGRSTYANVAYGLFQYPIQTFYDRGQASSLVAYGCETINDEEGKNAVTGLTSGADQWDGRANMMKDVSSVSKATGGKWETLESRYLTSSSSQSIDLVRACMSRNRDLNGDGKIDDEEIRWYAPTQQQYLGLWIGESVLSTEAKLYNRSTADLTSADAGVDGLNVRKLYYAATSSLNTYFSEEGGATGKYTESQRPGTMYQARYVRCIRNLKSGDSGYSSVPDNFVQKNGNDVDLSRIDDDALNTTGSTGELIVHDERQETDKPAKKFRVSANKYGTNMHFTGKAIVEGSADCSGYSESGEWRIPNLKEWQLIGLYYGYSALSNTVCRTKFSNQKFRYSWYIAGGDHIAMTPTDRHSNFNFSTGDREIRCISVQQ